MVMFDNHHIVFNIIRPFNSIHFISIQKKIVVLCGMLFQGERESQRVSNKIEKRFFSFSTYWWNFFFSFSLFLCVWRHSPSLFRFFLSFYKQMKKKISYYNCIHIANNKLCTLYVVIWLIFIQEWMNEWMATNSQGWYSRQNQLYSICLLF